jgi:low temperature requirement protein LtrA
MAPGVLWAAAAAIDYAGPAWLTREQLRSLQEVSVAHFAERYASFVIICLGESIVAIGVGVGTAERHLTPELVVAAGLALLPALGMWRVYLHRLAERAQQRLREDDDPVLAAADAYSYLHLVILAGIIIVADGVRLTVHHSATAPMPAAGRLALCGGVAVYLLGLAAFRLRIAGERSLGAISVAGALIALFALGGSLPAWSIPAGISILLGVLCALESLGAEPSED